jgi:hypothetical protein
MTMVIQMLAPISPTDRNALLEALAVLLQQEPVQPVGDGAVARHLRTLLRTGAYARSDTITEPGAKSPRHSGASILWQGAPRRYRGGA